MARFKNIKKTTADYATLPAPPSAPGPAESPKKKVEKKVARGESVVSQRPKEREIKSPKSSGSHLGKAVLIISFLVVIQVVLLVSLIYLSPILLR